MNRKTMLNIHLYLSSIFLPMLLLYSITGTLYYFGEKGSEKKVIVKEFSQKVTSNHKEVLANLLKENNIEVDYEYLKIKGSNIYLRPTSREYYLLKNNDSSSTLYKVSPSIQKAFMELHKGHGPGLFKYFSKIFGFGVMLITLSGLFLALSVKAFRNISLMTTGIGLIIAAILALI